MINRLHRTWLICLFFGYSIYIFVQGYYDTNGYLSSDSAHYLQLAQNMLNGNGMTTTDLVPQMSGYFATWPVGYPLLIAGVASISGMDVFWAAKLVNSLLFGLCLILLERLFGNRAGLVAFVFFISTATEIFAYTWSEVPFIFGLIWLVYGISRYMTMRRFIFAVQMLFAAVFLFMARYIGLIGACIIGLIGFYYLFKREWKAMLVCWVTGIIPILFAAVYLSKNYLETGQFTGMERIPRPETSSEFWRMLTDAMVAEFNLFSISKEQFFTASIVVLVGAIVLFIRPTFIKALFTVEQRRMLVPALFFFVSVIYFVAIVYMRWSSQFDPFNFRLLGPSTVMLWLAIVGWIAKLDGKSFRRWRNTVVLLFGCTFIMTILYDTYSLAISKADKYGATRADVLETFEQIPSGSIVALENIHARYLRTDLQYIKVYQLPYFKKKESVATFIERVTPNRAKGVYLQVRPLPATRYHQSFVNLMEENKDKQFVQLDKGDR
ncbi:hypothetical protein [Aquibacillus salsiterrae]|uniref:Uncharacterized protein n=1 Tax=Aquibacillus salsiterrae TaxID=2950439 RepID=A0A9X3WGP4_9BACI|nr:hypothetical protein [Aquibacillus salsiterrae]MDC3416701.1 hypothetical protein [Aquibacillus salsiterrae]